MVLEVRKVIILLEEYCPWYIFTAKNVPRNPVGTESLPGLRRLRICGGGSIKIGARPFWVGACLFW